MDLPLDEIDLHTYALNSNVNRSKDTYKRDMKRMRYEANKGLR